MQDELPQQNDTVWPSLVKHVYNDHRKRYDKWTKGRKFLTQDVWHRLNRHFKSRSATNSFSPIFKIVAITESLYFPISKDSHLFSPLFPDSLAVPDHFEHISHRGFKYTLLILGSSNQESKLGVKAKMRHKSGNFHDFFSIMLHNFQSGWQVLKNALSKKTFPQGTILHQVHFRADGLRGIHGSGNEMMSATMVSLSKWLA